MERKAVAMGSAVLVLLLASAGCGSTGPKQLSTAQFRAAAAKICTQRRAAYAAVSARHHGDFMGAIRAALPAFQRAVKELEGIRPPAELRSTYDGILAFEREETRFAAVVAKTGRVPPHPVDDGPPLHRHEAMRVRLGMEACN